MAEVSYEISENLLLELLAVCDAATETFDEQKAQAATNVGALEFSRAGWKAAECWRELCAIKDGHPYTPEPFEACHCLRCGKRLDTGEEHDCQGEALQC